MTTAFVFVAVCLIAATSGGRLRRDTADPRSIVVGPLNTATVAGGSVTLNCEASLTGSPRVQWAEYVTTSSGAYLSDGSLVLPNHPNSARYVINYDELRQIFQLVINPTVLADGGLYQCRDTNAGSGRFAQFVSIQSLPNCTTTLPANGIVTEGAYYTVECQTFYRASAGIAPYMRWTGSGNFTQLYVTTNTSVWAGAQFNVEKGMDGRAFQCNTNFTSDGFSGIDSATNVPTWSYDFQTTILFVQYGPQNISYSPILASYEIGMVLTCHASAVPLPTYKWTNMVTLVEYNSQSITLTTEMVGSLWLRCQIVNSVSSANIFANITLNPITTTTTTTPAPSTTTPLAVGPCSDLTGRWEAIRSNTSTIVLCLTVDLTQNGQMRGFLQNDSNDGFMMELIGRTRNNFFDEAGFAGIWNDNKGVSAFAAECHRCYNVETMYINLVSRSSLDTQFCNGGTVLNSPQYTFYRKPISYPCPAPYAKMEAAITAYQAGNYHDTAS